MNCPCRMIGYENTTEGAIQMRIGGLITGIAIAGIIFILLANFVIIFYPCCTHSKVPTTSTSLKILHNAVLHTTPYFNSKLTPDDIQPKKKGYGFSLKGRPMSWTGVPPVT